MRHSLRLACTLAIALAAPALHAQFQEPTQDELHMTADPKAPGAPAVFLNVEERTDDAIHYHSVYARIKILTEKGKELATVHVPYERGQVQIGAVQGRTIHPDGSLVKLQGSPADLLKFKGGGHQINDITFNLPAVEVGSIIEYYYQIRYSDDKVSSPTWLIQQDYFVHRAHYFFNPIVNIGEQVQDAHGNVSSGVLYSGRLPLLAHVVQDSQHHYTLDVTDVPPVPTGDYMPPLTNLRFSVFFFYSNSSPTAFWDSEGKYWAKAAEKFASTSGPVKKAAADLVASPDSEETKARKLYDAVMKLDNIDFSNKPDDAKFRGNKDAASVLKQQKGSATDLTLLYVALARAAGLHAWPMQVVNRDRAAFEPANLSADQFDDYIAVVQIAGKDVYLDPGEAMCPFGVMHWKHERTKGFRLSDKGVSVDETPSGPPKAAVVRRFADVTIDDKGSVTGTGRVEFAGQEALYWRQLALEEDKDELAKDFKDYLAKSLPDGVTCSLDTFDDLTGYNSDLVAHIKITGDLGAATTKRLIVPAFLFEARGKHPFLDDDNRQLPIDLHYATTEEDEVVYHLGAANKLTELPNDENLDWTGRIGFTTRFTLAEGALTVKRSFTRTVSLVDPNLFSNLRYCYKRVSNADQLQLVFDRGDQSASN